MPTWNTHGKTNLKYINMTKLTEIAKKYNTDKGVSSNCEWNHGYTEIYDRCFSMYESPNILEIGVLNGDSIFMYDDYYQGKCQIYCVDIEDKSGLFTNMPNIHFYRLDQASRSDWDKFNKTTKNVKFDIILDDGGHHFNQQIISLSKLHRRVGENGIYIVEDLQTSLTYGVSYNTLMLLNYFGTKHPNLNNYLTDDEFDELCSDIKDVIISNTKSIGHQDFFFNRSITSIITFNKQ